MKYHLAIDIGASSGRHILGHIQDGKMILEEVYRFENIQVLKDGHDCWDIDQLIKEVVAGIKECKKLGKIPSTMGIDTWGVDYVLLDKDGERVCDTVAYRDARTKGMKERLEETLPFEKLYEKTGIQYQPYNTIYQLMAHKIEHPEHFDIADRFLMIPEYLNYILTGVMMNEYTNASTTALLNAKEKTWDKEILSVIGIPEHIFGELNLPTATVGGFCDKIKAEVGFDCEVILPATHDTGSAFMAVPAKNDTSVYISSGTWSLLGVENSEPITNEISRNANFSNEGGFDYRFRYLKNIMGLWMIQSIRRELNGQEYVKNKKKTQSTDKKYSFAELEAEAREHSDFPSIIDVDAEEFLSPESMISAVKKECERTGQKVPCEIGEIMQCVYVSLAKKYAKSIKELESITGKTYTCIHIVGGGSRDGYLSKLTKEETGLPVYTGPIEGTALGNLMAQFIKDGQFDGLLSARSAIYHSFDIEEVK